ncbi:MAG TPA: hypothetical protein VF190_03240 [Rhodothermales bacterium]
MRVALAVALFLLIGLAASGCNARDPERIARDQLQAFLEANLKEFRGYFASETASRVDDAFRAANQLVTQRVSERSDSSGRSDRTNPFEIMASRALVGDLVEMVVHSTRFEGDRLEMEVEITYPDARALATDAMKQQVSEISGVPFEAVDQGLMDSFSVAHMDPPRETLDQLGARHRDLMTSAYRDSPERYRRVLDGTYVMRRRWGRWEVLKEPITESLLSVAAP